MRAIHLLSVLVLLLAGSSAARRDRLVLFAGGGTEEDGAPATRAQFVQPFGIDFDSGGNAYLVELEGNRLLMVDATGTFHVLAGTLRKKSDSTLAGTSGDGKPGREATFNGPHSVVVHPRGSVYIADTWNNRIRRYDPATGVVSAFGGTGKKGYAGDGGPARDAEFGGVYCIAFDPSGEKMYVADLDNRRIRAIDMATGRVDLVAGNGEKGVPADGAAARSSPLVDPRACAADGRGNVYILERAGHALRVVDSRGKIRTLAGTGTAGNSGDGGDARLATLNGPKHLVVDSDGNVIIADSSNHVVRKYTPADGRIVRLAGTGRRGNSGNGGDPLEVDLNEPHGVMLRADGTLFVVDSMNHRVFRWEKR